MIADLFADLFELLLEPVTAPVPPSADEFLPVAFEPQFPMREKLGWNDRGIMGPVLKQKPVPLQMKLEVLFLIGWPACSQNYVVCPGNGVDAVDLHEAQLIDDSRQVFALATALGR